MLIKPEIHSKIRDFDAHKECASNLYVEMMGLIGMGNNPMVGATVAVAVAIAEAIK